MDSPYDVAVVGGGPAGAVCAAFCAQGGLRTVLLERAKFPREKVCGDCLNPLAGGVLAELGLQERIESLPHVRLDSVEFIGCDSKRVVLPLPSDEHAEIGIKRSHLDGLLLQRASEMGADIRQETALTRIERDRDSWKLVTNAGAVSCRWLVAADGRNSTVARLLGLLPNARKDRVALQTHLPLPDDLKGRVRMQFIPQGYTGIADVGDGANLCLVSRPEDLEEIRKWAAKRYALADSHPWRSITPLARAPITPVHERLLLVGDVARVVEPFTGEGIAYAILTGAAAARALIAGRPAQYAQQHREIYSGRLWVNHLARLACLYPQFATGVVGIAERFPSLLSVLTRKVVHGHAR